MSNVVDINTPLPYDPASWSVDTACREALKRYERAYPLRLEDEAEGESMIAFVLCSPLLAPEHFDGREPVVDWGGDPPAGMMPPPRIRLVQRPYRARKDLAASFRLGHAAEAASDGDPILLERLPLPRPVVDKYLKLRGASREVSWMLPHELGNLLGVNKLRPDHVAMAPMVAQSGGNLHACCMAPSTSTPTRCGD